MPASGELGIRKFAGGLMFVDSADFADSADR
jgi:hypothetical protein